MKIALIYPTKLNEIGKPVKYRKAFLPSLSLAILNRLTPEHHEVTVFNDIVEDIAFSDSFDLVAITSMTSQINRAYQIADKFRRIGVKVIIGGVHAFFLPEEVKEHCDSVAIGEVENIWEDILSDAEKNSLKPFYKDDTLPDLKKLVVPKWDNINLKIYPKSLHDNLPIMPVYTTRGCPYGCTFCSVTKFFGKEYRVKPVENVLMELDEVNAETYFFVDDNIICRPDYARELFKALAKKDIKWISQISTTLINHPDLVDLAAKAGCFAFIFGLETINTKNLESVKKTFNKVEQYKELFDMVRRAGIYPFPTMIYGFDYDSRESFQETLDFLMSHPVGNAAFFLLTPFPGTDLYNESKEKNDILSYDWNLYNGMNVLIDPKNMTEDELDRSYWKYYKKFFSIRNISKRMYHNFKFSNDRTHQLFLDIFFNLFFKNAVYMKEHPFSGGIFRKKSK